MGSGVGHANNKTKRRFLPNLHAGRACTARRSASIRLRVSAHAIRTVEHRGGLDSYLLEARDADLPSDLRRLKRRIRAARRGEKIPAEAT